MPQQIFSYLPGTLEQTIKYIMLCYLLLKLSKSHETVRELAELLRHLITVLTLVTGHTPPHPLIIIPQVLAVVRDGQLLQLGQGLRCLTLGLILWSQVTAIVPLQIPSW